MSEYRPPQGCLNPVGAALAARALKAKHIFTWFGNLSVTAPGPLEVPTLESFELNECYLFPEKQILVESFEQWLANWNREFGYFDRQASKKRMP
jgi:hypothetical protein